MCFNLNILSTLQTHLNRESSVLIIYIIPYRYCLCNFELKKKYSFPSTNCNTGLLTVHNYISNVHNVTIFLLKRLPETESNAFRVPWEGEHAPTWENCKQVIFPNNMALSFSHACNLTKQGNMRSQLLPENYAGNSLLLVTLNTDSLWSRVSVACSPASSGQASKHHSVSARQEIMAVWQ